MSDLLAVTRDDRGVVTVSLDGPPANALSVTLMHELRDLAATLVAARDVRVAVVRSSVPGIFMAGADLNDVLAHLDDVATLNTLLRAALDGWERLPFPTIAVIAGHAFGGGCELSLACDFRLMARGRARIGLPEVKRGLLAAGGGTQRALRLLGRARALDFVMRGRPLDADEAWAYGLITESVAPEDLDDRASALVAELLALPAKAVAAAKAVVLGGADLDLAAGLDLEAAAMVGLVSSSSDTREGIMSFLEKRDPVFTGG